MIATGENTPGAGLYEARVLTVDNRSRTCSVQLLRSERVMEEVSFATQYAAIRGGGWAGSIPESGDEVIVARLTNSGTLHILAYKSLPESEPPQESDRKRANFGHDRDRASEGDQGTWGSAGNRVTVRRSGLVEAYAAGLAQTRWSRADRSIRSFAFQSALEGPFGSSAYYTKRDPANEDRRRTPTGVSSWLKATSEGPEVVNVELGAVVDELPLDLPGRPRHSGEIDGSVAVRLLLFDPQVAARYANARQRPHAANAISALRMDLSGNASVLLGGKLTEVMESRHSLVSGRASQVVGGDSSTQVDGGWSVTSQRKGVLSTQKGLDLFTDGTLRIRCNKLQIEEGNGDRVVRGDYRMRVGGAIRYRSLGDMGLSSAQTLSLSSLKGRSDTTAGRHIVNIGGGGVGNLGRDIPAYDIKVLNGAMRFNALTGSIQINIGPSEAPLAQILIRADKRNPATVGRIEIGYPLTQTGITLSPDGSWQILGLTRSGIRSDSAGRLQIGTPSPVVGNLISTLSQPTCYVTGLPFLGHSDVVVGASAPAPLIGAPSLGVVVPAPTLPPEIPVD